MQDNKIKKNKEDKNMKISSIEKKIIKVIEINSESGISLLNQFQRLSSYYFDYDEIVGQIKGDNDATQYVSIDGLQ